MNEYLLKSCIDVTNILTRRPIIKFFWSNCDDANLASLPPYSFETICKKLEKNLYPSYDDWISDVHKLFDFHITNNRNQVYQFSAKQLKYEFDELTSKFASNISVRLDKLKKIYSDLSELAETYESEFNNIIEDIHPAAEIFKVSAESIEDPIKIIKRNISLFKSPELVLRITAILYKLQPETIVVNGEQIRIEFALMNPDTISKLLHYTLILLEEIASGRLNPYHYSDNSKLIGDYSFAK